MQALGALSSSRSQVPGKANGFLTPTLSNRIYLELHCGEMQIDFNAHFCLHCFWSCKNLDRL